MKRGSRIGMAAASAFALLSLASLASAQPPPGHAPTWSDGHLWRGVIDTVIFAVLGIGLLALGYKIFARIVPWDVDHEIAHDHNVAAAIVMGSLFVSIAVVIAAALVS